MAQKHEKPPTSGDFHLRGLTGQAERLLDLSFVNILTSFAFSDADREKQLTPPLHMLFCNEC